MTLDERISALEARNAISELRSRYCWYTVRGLRDEVATLFTEDARFENSRNAAGQTIIVTGRAALQDFFSRMQPARRIPMVMNEVIAIKGDTAQGTCAMMSIGEDSFCGHYRDDFRKIGSRWLFSRRQFFPYWPQYRPDVDGIHP